MGIYFKGMKMPRNCLNCYVNTDYNYCPILCRDTSDIRYDERLDDCPIVEVKEPHGRLIDADELIEDLKHLLEYTRCIIEAEGAE